MIVSLSLTADQIPLPRNQVSPLKAAPPAVVSAHSWKYPAETRYNRYVNWLLAEETIRRALTEDLGHGDITTELLAGADQVVNARFLIKQDGVFCGGPVAKRCFSLLDPACTAAFSMAEGDDAAAGTIAGTVTGPARSVLSAERVALNFLQRLSGIATQARRLAAICQPHGIRVVETRKTTPGLRLLEKYAVRTGGGYNHRMDLDHAVMLKDNHFALAGGDPGDVVRGIKSRVSHTMKVIAEAGDPTMIEPLAVAGADVILLDNFTPDQVRSAIGIINGRAIIELSGGISIANIDQYLIKGVDVISIGALTHSFQALDISLDL